MPPRTSRAALTEDDLARLREALDEGKRPTVYLRDAVPSLGVDAASSARVVSVHDATVTVRPKGVSDDVPFEVSELYGSRAAALSAAALAAAAPPAEPRTRARRARTPKSTPSPAPVATPPPADSTATRNPRATVILSGTANGGWTVQASSGSTKRGKPASVSPEAVSRAVQALDDEAASAAVTVVLEHARRRAAERVAELSAQLQEAQASLHALGTERR